MSIVVVTGSAGLIGSEAARFFCSKNFEVVGIDNNMRKIFFGNNACTDWNRALLARDFKNYKHYSVDIRDSENISNIFKRFKKNIALFTD